MEQDCAAFCPGVARISPRAAMQRDLSSQIAYHSLVGSKDGPQENWAVVPSPSHGREANGATALRQVQQVTHDAAWQALWWSASQQPRCWCLIGAIDRNGLFGGLSDSEGLSWEPDSSAQPRRRVRTSLHCSRRRAHAFPHCRLWEYATYGRDSSNAVVAGSVRTQHWPPVGIDRGVVVPGHKMSQVEPPPHDTEHEGPVQVT